MHLESDDELASLLETGITLPSLHHCMFPLTYQAMQQKVCSYSRVHCIHSSANRPAFRESGAAGQE
jgi:hypothetical protein